MAATKLLLLLFSVVLLGLTSADVEDDDSLQENTVQNSDSEENAEPEPQDTLLEEQDSRENQGKKSFGKSQDKKRSGGRQGLGGPRGNGGGSSSQNRNRDDGQKSEKPKRPFGPPGKNKKNHSLDAKKRRGGQ